MDRLDFCEITKIYDMWWWKIPLIETCKKNKRSSVGKRGTWSLNINAHLDREGDEVKVFNNELWTGLYVDLAARKELRNGYEKVGNIGGGELSIRLPLQVHLFRTSFLCLLSSFCCCQGASGIRLGKCKIGQSIGDCGPRPTGLPPVSFLFASCAHFLRR